MMQKDDDEQTILCLRDEAERAEALRLAAELPEAWLADTEAARDAIAAAEASAEGAERMQALLTPLAAEAEARVLDHVVGEFLRASPRATAAPARPAATRWWLLASLPVTAAVAATATFMITQPMHRPIMTAAPEQVGRVPGSLVGEVRISPVLRGDGGSSAAGGSARVPSGESFLLDCRAEGRSLDIVAVHAEPVEPIDAGMQPQALGWERRATASNGATLRVRADLPRGIWQVFCAVHEPGTGRLMRLEPPAALVVE